MLKKNKKTFLFIVYVKKSNCMPKDFAGSVVVSS